MADYKAAQDDFDAQIAQVTLRIEHLENERTNLRRCRNVVAPISQIPPELLLKIFSLCNIALGDDELRYITNRGHISSQRPATEEWRLRDAYDKLRYPNVLRVYHVNHNWRQLVAGSPHLWTRIQVQSKTRPEIVSFMRDKAGAHPIELEYVGGPYWATDDAHEPDPKFLPTIQDILRASSQNIKSIAIYSSQSVPQQLLVRIVEGADRLESLIISLGERSYYSMPPIPVNTRELSAVVIPGLRRLSLEGLMCPWKSSLLTSSPHLTDVTLRRTEPSSPQGVADLLDFLRRLPKIECLRFRLLRPHSQPVNEVFFLGKSDLSRATPLFRLQELSIYSESPSLLSAILSAITIPKFIPSLSLLSGPRPRARAISTHDRLHDRIRRAH
ncbi:hypothetical protein FA13DRAFT_391325 [Coprinellus micaceus]|uniref:Uncharacterized protein n=1 Tax=Coprinellus micaceus TaxID=71717 RepID=A0A4Y7TWX9_COPMI|nr:hypothetical protein FA13DRAFT_391325 [Coprinellus micaceus]